MGVVVIDVLRSFTTAAYALARGADEVMAVDSIEAARALRAADPGALAIGAIAAARLRQAWTWAIRRRGWPRSTCAAPRDPVHRGRHARAARLPARRSPAGASLVCASATAACLLTLAPPSVTLVVTGIWSDRDGDEDHACADLIEALLLGRDPPRSPYAARVRDSDFGRRFRAGTDPICRWPISNAAPPSTASISRCHPAHVERHGDPPLSGGGGRALAFAAGLPAEARLSLHSMVAGGLLLTS